jgi:predicted dithiol-disulfide oxidoreductase (DUF899 family)
MLLAKKKAFTKARDQLSAARRAPSWVKVEKNYVFDSAARNSGSAPARRIRDGAEAA